jgi:hypothetical protein
VASVLSINWIVLIASGVLLTVVFRRALGSAAARPIREPEERAK